MNASYNGHRGYFALIPDPGQQNKSFLTWIEKANRQERERAEFKMTTSDQSLVSLVWFEPTFIRTREYGMTLYFSVSTGTEAIVMSSFPHMVKKLFFVLKILQILF